MSRTFLHGAIAWRGRALSGRELLAVGAGGDESVDRADPAGFDESLRQRHPGVEIRPDLRSADIEPVDPVQAKAGRLDQPVDRAV